MKSHCVMADLHIYVYMNLTKFVCSSMFGTVTSIKKSDKYNLVINGQTVHIRTEISSMCYVHIYICMDGSPYCDDTVHILRVLGRIHSSEYCTKRRRLDASHTAMYYCLIVVVQNLISEQPISNSKTKGAEK